MSERTAREIRAYCEAASEGPWLAEIGVPYSGLVRDKDNNFAIAQHMEAGDAQFLANARADLPRLLDAAVALWRARASDRRCMLEQSNARFVASGEPSVSEEEMERLIRDEPLLGRTAWLEE